MPFLSPKFYFRGQTGGLAEWMLTFSSKNFLFISSSCICLSLFLLLSEKLLVLVKTKTEIIHVSHIVYEQFCMEGFHLANNLGKLIELHKQFDLTYTNRY